MIFRKRKPHHQPRTSPSWKLYAVRFELDGVERKETVEAHSREEARFLVRHFWGRAAKLLKTPERIEDGNS